MTIRTLYECGYGVNTPAYKRLFCDPYRVERDKNLSELQRVFIERLGAEMEARKISGNALSRMARDRGFRVRQASISRILAGKQDPSLGVIHAIANTLGLPAWYLLTHQEGEERVIRTPTVVALQKPDYRVMKRTRQDEKVESPLPRRKRS